MLYCGFEAANVPRPTKKTTMRNNETEAMRTFATMILTAFIKEKFYANTFYKLVYAICHLLYLTATQIAKMKDREATGMTTPRTIHKTFISFGGLGIVGCGATVVVVPVGAGVVSGSSNSFHVSLVNKSLTNKINYSKRSPPVTHDKQYFTIRYHSSNSKFHQST